MPARKNQKRKTSSSSSSSNQVQQKPKKRKTISESQKRFENYASLSKRKEEAKSKKDKGAQKIASFRELGDTTEIKEFVLREKARLQAMGGVYSKKDIKRLIDNPSKVFPTSFTVPPFVVVSSSLSGLGTINPKEDSISKRNFYIKGLFGFSVEEKNADGSVKTKIFRVDPLYPKSLVDRWKSSALSDYFKENEDSEKPDLVDVCRDFMNHTTAQMDEVFAFLLFDAVKAQPSLSRTCIENARKTVDLKVTAGLVDNDKEIIEEAVEEEALSLFKLSDGSRNPIDSVISDEIFIRIIASSLLDEVIVKKKYLFLDGEKNDNVLDERSKIQNEKLEEAKKYYEAHKGNITPFCANFTTDCLTKPKSLQGPDKTDLLKGAQSEFHAFYLQKIQDYRVTSPNLKDWEINELAEKETLHYMTSKPHCWTYNRIKWRSSQDKRLNEKSGDFDRPSFLGPGSVVKLRRFWWRIFSHESYHGAKFKFSANDTITVYKKCNKVPILKEGYVKDDLGDDIVDSVQIKASSSSSNDGKSKENDSGNEGGISLSMDKNIDNDDITGDYDDDDNDNYDDCLSDSDVIPDA